MKNNTINLTINSAEYSAVPVEVARAIEVMLAQYKTTSKTTTKKSEPRKTVERVKVYALCEDGKSVTLGGNGFIPAKVFKGVTYSLKQAGAKWDKGNNTWVFKSKKACTDWCKEQDARA